LEADSNVKRDMLKTVAAASIQLCLAPLSSTLIVSYRSAPSQPSDDFNEFLPLLETMLELVLLRGLPSAHFGKELHRAACRKGWTFPLGRSPIRPAI
jgi:hypothetical protein